MAACSQIDMRYNKSTHKSMLLDNVPLAITASSALFRCRLLTQSLDAFDVLASASDHQLRSLNCLARGHRSEGIESSELHIVLDHVLRSLSTCQFDRAFQNAAHLVCPKIRVGTLHLTLAETEKTAAAEPSPHICTRPYRYSCLII